jgi:hypothetical protein
MAIMIESEQFIYPMIPTIFPGEQYMTDLELVTSAIQSTEDNDQKKIADYGIQWLAMMLRKNADYGSSVFKKPLLAPSLDAGSVILVRMSDKISRLENLCKGTNPQVNETFLDTVSDLGAYCLLYMISQEKDVKDGNTGQ